MINWHFLSFTCECTAQLSNDLEKTAERFKNLPKKYISELLTFPTVSGYGVVTQYTQRRLQHGGVCKLFLVAIRHEIVSAKEVLKTSLDCTYGHM